MDLSKRKPFTLAERPAPLVRWLAEDFVDGGLTSGLIRRLPLFAMSF
jgi:hypothetical protein